MNTASLSPAPGSDCSTTDGVPEKVNGGPSASENADMAGHPSSCGDGNGGGNVTACPRWRVGFLGFAGLYRAQATR